MYQIMSGGNVVATYENGILTVINEALAPIYLKRTGNFEKWVSERAIDAVRPNSRILKKAHGLSRLAGDFETAMKYNAACITDNYWVMDCDSAEIDLTWDNVRFDSDIYFRAAIASDNDILSQKSSRTPELTNIGSREKGWRLEEGNWWLYKSEPAQNQRFELLTYKIGLTFGFDMACYDQKDGFIRTRDFTAGKVNLQHIDALVYDHDGVTDDDLFYNYETLHAIDPSLADQYLDIKCLDSLVNNPDRHTKNYGLLTSQSTGEILSLAPNYDNDMAFYGYPDIFEKDRRRGEIADFLKLAKEVHYLPPVPDESRLMEALSGDPDADRIYKYVMDGIELLR